MKKTLSLLFALITALVAIFAPSHLVEVLLGLAALAASAWLVADVARGFRRSRLVAAINTNPANFGTHDAGRISMLATAAITTRYKLVKKGADALHIAIPTATADEPIGVCEDQPAAAEDPVNVIMLGAHDGTIPMVAGGTITDGADLYMKSDGNVVIKPTAAGTYWGVGSARGAWAINNVLEVIPRRPRKLIVIAALGNVDGAIAALTISGTYSQAEVQALRAAAETLADDVRAIAAALNGAADVALATT